MNIPLKYSFSVTERTTAKRDLKRQRILDAAKSRFSRFGIRATTIQDIARDADLAVGTIYQFFPDKDALTLAWVEEHRLLIRQQLEDILALPVSADEKLREFLRVRFRTVRMMREVPAITEITRTVLRLAPEKIEEMTRTALGYVRDILEEGRKSRCFPSADPAVDAEILFLSLAGFFLSNEDPIHPKPDEAMMLRVVDWFISKWQLPRPKRQR
jgi:AcrR family transcriptional regulator